MELTTDKSTAKKVTTWIVAVVTVLLLVGAGMGVAYLWNLKNTVDEIETVESFPDEAKRPQKAEPEEGKKTPENILLLGSDTRDENDNEIEDIRGERSDTMMLMHIPGDRENVEVISFMRDLWVEIPGYGVNKLNAAMAFGGVPLLVETLEGWLGIRIDHVAVIDFTGFENLTDALGGVTVNNAIEFSSGGEYFAAGEITLTGKQALKYVRARYPFSDGDYQRVRNQQAFMRGVMKEVLSRDTLTDPVKIAGTASAFAPFVKVDQEFDSEYMVKLGMSMRDIRSNSFRFLTAPTLGTGMEGDQSVVYPDFEKIAVIAEHLQKDTMSAYVPVGD